jgi:hypothetical protein
VLHVALTPVRHKVDTLKDRRAKKIAWDNRKAMVPTPAERAQAKAWAKGYLKREKPPFGLMLSLLAGPLYGVPEPAMDFGSGGFGDPTTATIIASVPTLLAIVDSILKRSAKNGEAPAGGHGGGGGGAAPAGGGAPAAPDAPGTVDLTPAQNAADGGAAADAGGDASADDGSGGGGGKGKHGGKGGGKMLGGLTKKQLMIGGAVVGGIILISLLMPKKS